MRRAVISPPPPTLADYDAFARRRPASGEEAPIVSVVTVVRNAVLTLPRTITSVQAQTEPSIEHIVVDGGSEDGSVEVIKHLLRPQDYWMSEPDRGISDAFNKGIALARGRYIQILNADDWLTPGQMNMSAAALAATSADFVFGDCLAFEGDRAVFRYRGDPDYAAQLHRRMHAMNHPSMLVRRSAYAQYGLFAVQLRNAMDYEWLLRAHRRGARGIYDPRITTNFSLGGVTFREARRTMGEVRDISVAYGRARIAAALEYHYHVSKGAVAHRIRQRARPVYDRMRAWINPSFQPLAPARDAGRDTDPSCAT